MFHVKPDYINTWREYYKALKNRNNLLRRKKVGELGSWERAMWCAARIITAQRNMFIEGLAEALEHAAQELLIPVPTLEYECGWQTGVDLDRFLAGQRQGDMEKCVTRYGLHRSDITIYQEGREVSRFCSRGQIKLCVAALSLALDSVFRKKSARTPIMLVDDLPAELDYAGQQRIIHALAERGGQVFITTTGDLPTIKQGTEQVFHVKQGGITP